MTSFDTSTHFDLLRLRPSLREAALRLRSVTTPTTTPFSTRGCANDYAQDKLSTSCSMTNAVPERSRSVETNGYGKFITRIHLKVEIQGFPTCDILPNFSASHNFDWFISLIRN